MMRNLARPAVALALMLAVALPASAHREDVELGGWIAALFARVQSMVFWETALGGQTAPHRSSMDPDGAPAAPRVAIVDPDGSSFAPHVSDMDPGGASTASQLSEMAPDGAPTQHAHSPELELSGQIAPHMADMNPDG